MVSRVDNILSANINDDADDDVSFSVVDTAPANPFLHYTADNGEAIVKADDDKRKERPKSGKKTATSSKEGRPKSATRKRPT
jgi:hypothetical protein